MKLIKKWGRDRTTRAMTFDCYWKKIIENWIRMKKFSIFVRAIMQLLFAEIYKLQVLFDVQGVWHSPKMAPTMVHDQVFHIMFWQPPMKGYDPISNMCCQRIHWVALWVKAWETSPVPNQVNQCVGRFE